MGRGSPGESRGGYDGVGMPLVISVSSAVG